MNPRVTELKKERSILENRIFQINQDIYQITRQCEHPSTIEREARVLEPRWNYEMAYAYDKTGERTIESRSVACSDCGKSWTEMRFTDAEWYESNKWGQVARDALEVKEDI